MRQVVCEADEIPAGAMRRVMVGSRSLLVGRVGSTFYAMRNICPHQGADLSCGTLGGTNLPTTNVREFNYARHGEIVRCPWHLWEFDLITGRSLHDPDGTRVKTYPVTVEDGKIVVDV